MTETPDPMPEHECLRLARIARGWTQTELGRRVGTSRHAISEIESGKVKRSRFIVLIKEALGIPLDARAEHWVACGRRSKAAAAPQQLAAAAPEPETESEANTGATLERLDADYEFFAAERLRIRAKSGAIVPLLLNRAQRHIHEQLEAQKAATGKVRALILKGRQQGCSTYVGGRFYHRASRHGGLRVFILTHEEQATRNLFEMVERFHDHCAERPSTGVANASELYFDALDSGYKVGTAGTKGVGRSSTVQLFHGSEVAFWPYAQSHAAGVLQAVADAPGTEAILESTANGVGNLFHKMWRDAETGLGEYDRHAMAWRRGRRVTKVETRMKLDTVQAAGWVKSVIDADKPAKVFIDIGNAGAGVYDQLTHMGPPYSTTVEAVNFGSTVVEPAPLDEQGRPYGGPLNRRAEMWLKSKQWLEGDVPVQIPDSDSLQADACGPGYRYDDLTRLVLEKKEDMRRRGAKSPDEWDAVALTFARPVKPSNFHRKLVYPPLGLA